METMEIMNGELLEGMKPLYTLRDFEQPKPKSFWFKVKCLMQLCPLKKNMEWIVKQHMGSTKHLKAIEESTIDAYKGGTLLSSRHGRPWTTYLIIVESNQDNLHTFSRCSAGDSQQGEESCIDSNAHMSYTCWGYWDPCVYGVVSYEIVSLLDTNHVGQLWCPETHVRASFFVHGVEFKVNGLFLSCRFP